MSKTLEQLMKELNERRWWQDIRYWPFRAWNRFTDFLRSIKWAWQRAYRGFDDTAYWGLDTYLGDIALPVLKYLKENKVGVPGKPDSEEFFTEEEWDAELDKMIKAFELMQQDDYGVKEWEARNAEIKVGLRSFGDNFRALWD